MTGSSQVQDGPEPTRVIYDGRHSAKCKTDCHVGECGAPRTVDGCGGCCGCLGGCEEGYHEQLAEAARVGRDIPEEMVERAARELFAGPHHRFKLQDGEPVEYTVTWDEAEDDGPYGRDGYRRQAHRILSAALAGRQVVDLPERSETNSHERHGTWIIDGDLEVSFEAFLHWNDASPTVEVGHERGGTVEWGTEALRAYCLAGLAACEFADRLAAGSGSGEG